MINTMIPYMIVLIIFAYGYKLFANYMMNKENKRKVEKPRSNQERIFVGLKNVAKSSTLLTHKPVIVKGDGIVPDHKVGESISGVVPMNDEYAVFIRPKWWMFWKPATCLLFEPELTDDLNGGEIHIRGRGIEPLGDRYAYVIPPSKYFDDIKIEEVERRRSRIAHKRTMQLLNFDLNEHIDINIRTALTGDEEMAFYNLYTSGDVPRVPKDRLERERERERADLEEHRRKGGSNNNTPSQYDQMGGGVF